MFLITSVIAPGRGRLGETMYKWGRKWYAERSVTAQQ